MLINSPNISGSLNVSGNTVITGSLTTSIAALNTPATTFLTSNNGTIRSRTAAQTLSDIGAQATGSYLTVSNASNLYVPYTGATASVNLGYNSLAASNINIDGNAPTAGSYLGFKQATTVNTGVAGYTSISTFGTNRMTFSFAQPTGFRSVSFTVSEITQDVSGGRVYTMPDSNGTLALTSNLGAYLPLTGGTITGSLTVTGDVIAQTLNVQEVTSSIVYSSGSNIFGNDVSNTQQFTGSLAVTGSLSVNGAGTFTGTLNGTTSIFGSPLSVNQTSKIGIGFDSEYGRINSWGADTDTYGGLSFEISKSNGGTYQAFRINPTGDVFFGSGGYYANVEAGSLRVSYATALSQALTPLNSKFVNSANNFVKIGLGQGETNPNFNPYYGIIGLDNSTTLANNKLRFYIGNADTATAGHSNDQLVIQGDGKVGIGTSTPSAELQVVKSSDVTIAMSNSSSVTSGNRGTLSWYNSSVSTVAVIRAAAVTDNVGTELQFHTRPAAGSLTQAMTLSSSGRLGIGETSPVSSLVVSTPSDTSSLGSSGIVIQGSSTLTAGNVMALSFTAIPGTTRARAAVGSVVGSDWGKGNLTFYTRDASDATALSTSDERMRITSAGNVGIGTTNARTRLQVTPQSNAEVPVLGTANGVATFTSANTNYGLQFNSTSDGSFHIQSQRFDNIATAYNLILNFAGGSVGIGTTSPTQKLDIFGGGLAARNAGAGTFITGKIVPRDVSNQTTTIATVSSPGGNDRVFFKIQVINVSAVNNYGNAHVGYALWTSSGSPSVTTMTLDTGNSNIGNSNVGTLSWSGNNLQYTTNGAGNYEHNHIIIQAVARDNATVS